MTDPFVHLHVASGYSLRYGASHPHVLVQRAADHGMDTLALTDRDGCYGAVKFVQACQSANVRPILGVDLANECDSTHGRAVGTSLGYSAFRGVTPPTSQRRKPARGGAFADAHDNGLPRVVLLAQNKRGWAAICRLVSAAHPPRRGGKPITTHQLIAQHASADVIVLLGPGSDVGRALAVRRPDVATAALRKWQETATTIVIEVVHHRGPTHLAEAARLAGFAADHQLQAVLSNAVRYADRADAPVVDVLHAAPPPPPPPSPPPPAPPRRLVALDLRHIDRVNGEAYLKSGKEMADLAT